MRRHDNVSEVELVEDDDQPDDLTLVTDAGSGPGTRPGSARTRRRLRRAWPVPLAIVTALVVAVWVGDVTERARMQQLREDARLLPGVVATLTEDVTFTQFSDAAVSAMSFGARVDGVAVGPGMTVDESEAVVGVDVATGEVLWDWTPHPGRLSADGYASATCWPTGATVTCTSGWSSYSTTPDGDTTYVVAEPATRLVELDPGTGAVRSEAEHDGMLTGDGDDEVSVLVATTAGGLQVTATRPGADEVLWTTTLPLDPAEDLTWLIADVADAVHVYVDARSWALDRADGSVRHEGNGYQVPARADRLVEPTATRPAVLSSDGTTLGRIDGSPVDLSIDDGSSPELELFVRQDGAEPSTLVALDVRDGSEAWTSPMPDPLGSVQSIVLGGTLYTDTSTGPAARELGTGEQRWAAESDDVESWGLVTDGAVLATLEQQDDGVHLVARSLESGDRLWDVLTPVDARGYLFSAQGSAVLSGSDENIYLIGPGPS